MNAEQRLLLTKDAPASWLHIASGILKTTDILLKSINNQSMIDKPFLIATSMAIGQLGAQACEFSLKGLLFDACIEPGRIHSCTKLFELLPLIIQQKIENDFIGAYSALAGIPHMTLAEFLMKCGDKNVEWRYLSGDVGFDLGATKSFVLACERYYYAVDRSS